MKTESCDPPRDVDWSEASSLEVVLSAQENIPGAKAELARREKEAQELDKQELQKAINDWRKDWVSQDTDDYLSHYSKKFFYSDGGFQKWADYKRGVQATKPKVTIHIEDVSMFAYPGFEEPIILVNFVQDFRSPTLKNKMLKRQYWVNENGQWKIFYEGAA